MFQLLQVIVKQSCKSIYSIVNHILLLCTCFVNLLPLSKNLSFRSIPIGNSRICSFSGFMKQNRLGLRKLSSVGEGGEGGVAVGEEEQLKQQQETVSPSHMLTMIFQDSFGIRVAGKIKVMLCNIY